MNARGFPMLPAVRGPEYTKKQMLLYTLLLAPVSVLPSILGYASWHYGFVAAGLSVFFIFTAVRVMADSAKNDPGQRSARAMFGYSIFYLFAIFLALMVLR